MDQAGAVAALGQQLHDFFVTQFAPPAGLPAGIAFLPLGIAVDPETFYISGQINPLLVQAWLAVVADPITEITSQTAVAQQGQATQVMELIAKFAQPTDPIGSPAADFIGALKAADSGATMPSSDVVTYAPLDWYDPAKSPQWPTWTGTSGSSDSDGQPPAQPPILLPPKMWQWRTIDDMPQIMFRRTATEPDPQTDAIADDEESNDPAAQLTPTDPKLTQVATSLDGSSAQALPLRLLMNPVGIDPGDPLPRRIFVNLNWLDNAAKSANAGTSTAVTTSSLTLRLRYQVVELSRTWWSDSLVKAKNWCFPGQPAGSTFGADLPDGVQLGLTTSLILTDGVQLSGTWTDVDRSSAESCTHIGPWAIPPGTKVDTTSGLLQLSGMTAVAVIYQALPKIPPADDPNLSSGATPAPSNSFLKG